MVNKITTQSYTECVYKSSFNEGYDIEVIKWLQEEKLDRRSKVLKNANKLLVTFIVKPLIKHFYQPVRSIHGYQITFVRRNVWHSFQDRAFNELQVQGYIKKCGVHNLKKSRGILKIMPKSSCEILAYRILVSANRKENIEKLRCKMFAKTINELAKKKSSIGKSSLYNEWKSYNISMKSDNLYGIKMDIKDAFGNVDINVLSDVVNHMPFKEHDKLFILHHINNQYVTYRKQLYKWEHGLLQGDNLSSSLCNLYISHLESKLVLKYKVEGNFLYRVVDDYFFCSDKLIQITQFENDIKNLFPMKESKTHKILLNNYNYELNYCGQIFDLQSREVGRDFHFDENISLRYKFKLWNVKNFIPEVDLNTFILTCLQFKTNNFYFKPMELNTSFNTEKKVLCNYFESMTFIAYKFDVVIKSLVQYRKPAASIPNLTSTIKKIISIYAKICFKSIKKHKGKYYSEKINVRVLFQIGLKAFILVLKRCN